MYINPLFINLSCPLLFLEHIKSFSPFWAPSPSMFSEEMKSNEVKNIQNLTWLVLKLRIKIQSTLKFNTPFHKVNL